MNLVNYISMMRFELLSLAAVVVLLLLKVLSENKNVIRDQFVSIALLALTLVAGFVGGAEGEIFGSMFRMDQALAMEKAIIALGALLIALQAHGWLKEHPSSQEFYILLFSVLMGMYFMISAGHFLMFYLGLELATIPLAALAAFEYKRARSSEGAVKMILSSAFSSAILLFGISLIYGIAGTLDFRAVAAAELYGLLPLAGMGFILAGFAFKISVVPFHLWTADTYEGSPVAVTSFLSVISKGAAVFIMITILFKVFGMYYEQWSQALVVLAALTMTIGNLFALRQQNLKRFLAFSSITQAGYILIGVVPAEANSMSSVLYFLLIYIFSNVAAFTVVTIIYEKTGRDSINDYKGLYKTNPKLAVVMMVALLSLAGVPPTAGFFGKLFLMVAGASNGFIFLISVAALNMIVSLYYYLRIVKAMFVDESADPVPVLKSEWNYKVVLIVCLLGILLIGFLHSIYDHLLSLSFGA